MFFLYAKIQNLFEKVVSLQPFLMFFRFISKFIFLVNSGTNNMHINIYNETNTVQKRKKDSKEMVDIKWFQR